MVMELQSLNYRENMGLSFSALNLHDDNAKKILCANFVQYSCLKPKLCGNKAKTLYYWIEKNVTK